MIKSLLLKLFLVFILLVSVFNKASAQYAIGGTAGINLAHSVYWLTWDKSAPGSTLISAPPGADAFNVLNGTYVWQFSPTVRITAIISNEVVINGTAMQVYTAGTYSGDGLDLIYSGNNLPKPNSRAVANSGLVTPYGGTVTFDIDIKVAILINNVYVDVVYPGMVIADAESVDANGEYFSGSTPNPIAWQLLNKRTQGNAADSHYKMDLSNGGRSFKIYADLQPGNFGVQAVMFAHGARNLTNVSMKGSGNTAIAVGFVLPFDLGDAPSTYGTAGHYMDQFQITDYYAGDGTYSVVNYNTTPLVAQATVYIGANNVDPDGQPVSGINANDDDNTGNNDESTINPVLLPDVKVNQTTDISFVVPVTNTKSVPAIFRAWIDFNGDGIFGSDEQVTISVPANTINQNITVLFPNALFAGKVKAGPLYARLRITTSNLIDDPSTIQDERSVSFAADGEAEDYRFKDVLPISITGTVVDDPNGKNDGVISGTGIQSVSGIPLYAYLADNNNIIVDKVQVGAGGAYAFSSPKSGTYTVAISTNNVPVGGTLAQVPANLPPGWVPSGETYGVNNSGQTGIESGTPNLQIQVNTPGTSLNVSGVNFGLNQAPVAVGDAANTIASTPLLINVPGNDSDLDGTLDATSVLLIDPTDNVKKTSVTVTGQGTFTVNTTTGSVVFVPLTSFAGKVIPIAYTIKDNFGTESNTALISVIVKPNGVNDTDITTVGTAVTTAVKSNDGAEAPTTTVTATNGAHGTTVVDATGNVIYRPTAGYAGVDTYTYTLTTTDGIVSDPITVTISIKLAGVPDNATTPINTPVTTAVTANDGSGSAGATVIPTNGTHGTTTVDATGNVIYTPALNYIGKDIYTYTLTKGGVTSDPIVVNVNVKPVGVNDNDITPVNTPVTTIVKANDGLSATGTTVTATPGLHGVTIVDATGKVTYTPVEGYIGNDVYTYTLTTADGVISDPITVTISIYASSLALTKKANNTGSFAGDVINYTLVVTNTGTSIITNINVADAGADAGSVAPASIASLAAGASTTVIAKHTLTLAEVNSGNFSNQASVSGTDIHGKTVSKPLSDDPTTPAVDDPTISIIQPLGTIDFAKTGITSATNITYTFIAKNTGNTTLNSVQFTDVKLNITNSPVTVPAGGLAPGAAVTFNYSYPLAQADKDAGTVTNTATISALTPSGKVATQTATAINTIPKSPVAVNDTSSTSIDKPVQINIINNDNPVNSTFDLSTIQIITQPLHGTVIINPDGTIIYTPNIGYAGTDSFTYRVKDKNGFYTNPATVNIVIAASESLKIPTLFTPNGDGINDTFEIRGLDLKLKNTLTIVNRWGNEVYRQEGYQNDWTGAGLNEGTYYYILQIKNSNGTAGRVYKGYITLLRTLRK